MVKTYSGNIEPEDNTIFVFGSNPEGRHGLGSAKVAVKLFGAKYGQGEGLQGNAYALPTTDLRTKEKMPLETITAYIRRFYAVAGMYPDKNFKVAYRNQPNEKTLCGYTGAELQSAFKAAGPIPENVWFSEEWANSGNLET